MIAAGPREAWVVVDLGFGDAGKGTVTDHLVRARGAELVVRCSGGAQAGHNVVTDDGRHHTFSQFGAGTLAGARTLLGPAFLLHPLAMDVEARRLAALGVDPWPRTAVDERCRVITPYHQEANRRREAARGAAAHGTCGVGVGECVADDLVAPEDTVRAGDLADVADVRRRLQRQRARKRSELQALGVRDLALFDDPDLPGEVAQRLAAVASRWTRVDDAAQVVAATERVVFEGAQGVLLDETWGFHPHTTWSDVTCAPALGLLDGRPTTRLGVVRSYATRHGAGPFPTEGSYDRAEPHNGDSGPQGRFRTGLLDATLLRYALDVCPVDGLAVTHLDGRPQALCVGYEGAGPADLVADGRLQPGRAEDLAHRLRLGAWLRTVTPQVEPRDPLAWLDTHLAPVRLESWGPTPGAKRWR